MLRRLWSSGLKASRGLRLIGLVVLLASSVWPQEKAAQDKGSNFTPYVWALEYGVSDLRQAADFYTGALGFEREENPCCAPAFVLRNRSVRLLLREEQASARPKNSAGVNLNMRVGDLKAVVAAARIHGARIDDPTPQPFALGMHVSICDPFDNVIHLLDVANDDMTAESKPAVFNLGVLLENLEAGEKFYTKLNFQVYSREYLPDLPFQKHGAVSLVMHGEASNPAKAGTRNGALILAVDDLKSATSVLQSLGVEVKTDAKTNWATLKDPSDNILKLIPDLPKVQAANAANGKAHASSPEFAKAAFERFKKLEGKWQGKSTKGWEEAMHFKTIARGSVVVENSFDAHPNETMMTMFLLDGDRLLLTHYCVAGSQPRLAATSFEEDGRKITFTFLDATNLPSRDKGHMDKAVFHFVDENYFTSRWTWYQDGKENWMEEIRLERAP